MELVPSQLHKMYQSDVQLRTPDDGQKGCSKHVELVPSYSW